MKVCKHENVFKAENTDTYYCHDCKAYLKKKVERERTAVDGITAVAIPVSVITGAVLATLIVRARIGDGQWLGMDTVGWISLCAGICIVTFVTALFLGAAVLQLPFGTKKETYTEVRK